MKRIIITGPTGAIGIAIINEMIAQHVEVIAVCNPKSARTNRIPQHPLVTIVKCDLNHLDELKKNELSQCDVFYHLGWIGTIGAERNDMYLQNRNVKIALDAVELAKSLGCHTFIGAGSQAEYGRVEGVLRADMPTNPENGYGIAKLCAGRMTRLRCEQLEIKHIWMRILSVYGPYDGPYTLVSSMITALLSGDIPKTTAGEQLWDYLYSADAARAFYLAGKNGKDGSVYCLGSGKAYPLVEYIRKIRDTAAPEAEIQIGAIPYTEKQVMHLQADISDLQNDTGFEPEISFDEGITKTIAWYRNTCMVGENK